MTPDHEAAKKWAKRMRWTPEALTEEEINLARAYLDLLSREQRAVELLQRVAELERELEAARKVCEKATRWWDTATVAHDAGVEYRVKGDAESRLRAVAADAAHADTIVGLGEAIEAYRATKEPRDDE